MKTLSAVVFGCFLGVLLASDMSPKVQVYTRNPGFYGEKNILICHASGFQPPEIRIDILKNAKTLTHANQTDLAFDDHWQFHLTKFVNFTPKSGEDYACEVTHLGNTKTYIWEADM